MKQNIVEHDPSLPLIRLPRPRFQDFGRHGGPFGSEVPDERGTNHWSRDNVSEFDVDIRVVAILYED